MKTSNPAAKRSALEARPRAFIASLFAVVLTALTPPAQAQACDPTKSCCATPSGGNPSCSGSSSPAVQGSTAPVDAGVGNPINVITGNKYQREDDLSALPGVLGLEIVRHYNSVASGLNNPTSIFGRGWRLSYETELQLKGPNTLEIDQADGSVIVFNKVLTAPQQAGESTWTTANATQGRITSRKTGQGTEYRWRWAGAGGAATAGRELLFDAQGKLTQISAPTGEFVSLQHDPQGWLVQVTDPQGRSLHLNYLDKSAALADRGNNQRFRGVRSIDSPVGRYSYDYNDLGAQTPEAVKAELKQRGIDPVQLLANLVQVHLPTHDEADQKAHPYANRGVSSSSVSRIYHYEDPAHPTLLTGISVSGQGSDEQQVFQRIRTWAYDSHARANLSVKGEPARLDTDAGGKLIEPRRLAAGTGIEQVTLQWPSGGEVVLTNALGQETHYKTTRIASEYRLLEVRGAGCASCGPSNVRYDYDKLGQLIAQTRLGSDGVPIEGQLNELDTLGRTIKVSRIAYVNGRAQVAQWLTRYEYAVDPEQAQPILIATPSVIEGKEHQVRFEYNSQGQQTSVTETGFSPVDDKGQMNPAGAGLERRTTYGYQSINGRSLLAQIDGPLKNGDATRVQWDKTGNYVVNVTAPGGFVTAEEHDPLTGRLTARTDASGIPTRYAYAVASQYQPSQIERAGQVTRYNFDALGRITQVSDSAARNIKLHYDRGDHLVAVTDAQGYKAQTTLDAEGQALIAGLYEPEQGQPLRATYRWYDDQRRISKQLRADGRLDTWKYDNAGGVSEHVDGDDIQHLTRTNSAGMQAQIDLAPDGLISAALWSREGNQPKSIGTPQIRRDDYGRPVLEWRPEQGLKLRSYDAADHLVREGRLDRGAKAAGHVEQVFDTAGRLTQRLSYDVQGKIVQTIKRSYEGARLKAESNDAQETSYGYDEAGRMNTTTVTLKDEQGKTAYTTTLQTSYGPSGEADSKTLADGQVMRVKRQATGVASRIALQSAFWAGMHDRAQRWLPQAVATTIQGWLPETVIVKEIGFHPYNGITGYAQGNGLVTSREFDIAGRLTALKVGDDRSTLSYGVGPRIRAIEDQVKGVPSIKASYEYDGFGALKNSDAARPIRTAFNAAAPGASSANTAAIEGDRQGRTIGDGSYRYTYTESGQIETVNGPDGKRIAKYRYNAQGQRVSKSLDGQATTYYLWQSGKLVAEIEGGSRQGDVSVQYLYLSDEGKAAPIAKLETAGAPGNTTGKERVLYVHSDQRGQPTAMTDATQKVVWQAQSDAWGFIKTEIAQKQDAVMNIRLSGQYFDAETGLHDNWHRSYDARPQSPIKGSYLTPDPLGYPDGPDAYAYVGGDPMNKTDPTGQYQEDIHYYMTYFLAIAAGMLPQDSLQLALATQFVDNNTYTKPIDWRILTQEDRLKHYHFTLWTTASDGSIIYNGSPDLGDPLAKSAQLTALRSYGMPAGIAGTCALPNHTTLQFMGEFLHAFEDTYAHRDQNNIPIPLHDGLGHLTNLSEPDYTYNHEDWFYDSNGNPTYVYDSWQTNEARTLKAEQGTYSQIVAYMTDQNYFASHQTSGKTISFAELQNTLTDFNRTPENDETGFTAKTKLLNDVLASKGFPPIPAYNAAQACQNRQQNLNGLQQSDFPNAILATGCPS